MKMLKEPEIKLFGRKILLPESGEAVAGGEYSGNTVDCDRCMEVNVEQKGQEVDKGNEADGEEKQEQGGGDHEEDNALCESNSDDKQENQAVAEGSENTTNDDDDVTENHPKSETDQTEATNAQPKTLKKPDKILPCPRCNSMDTKFCYYNNYNVSQPRHFCKSCQRYWTAGGTMRNVPVGAGRRKNKNSTSHCRHITISEALQVAQIDAPNGFNSPKFKPNGTVLSFGPNSPLSEAVDKRVPIGVRNGDDTLHTTIHGSKIVNSLPLPVPCIPGVFGSFPWNSSLPLPAICPPGYSIPFYPTPYFSGMPNPWNAQWMQMQFPSNPGSQLGKHSRNGELIKPNNSGSKERSSDSSIVVPKTLRIDDPEEAAKSSIWTTLGIKYGSVRREDLFKALQPKGAEKKSTVNALPLMQANPAALSRSISFQERA